MYVLMVRTGCCSGQHDVDLARKAVCIAAADKDLLNTKS